MEPFTATAIIAAIVTGAASEAGKTTFSNAYESLKGLIKKKIGKNNDIIEAVSQLEKKPESEGRQRSLREEIQAVNADQDDEIHEAAIVLMEEIKSMPNGEKTIRNIAIAIANRNSTATVTITTNTPKN